MQQDRLDRQAQLEQLGILAPWARLAPQDKLGQSVMWVQLALQDQLEPPVLQELTQLLQVLQDLQVRLEQLPR